MWRAAVEACFYGNLFYGLCAAAQVTETSVQLALPFNAWLTAWSFIGTVMFYGYPYSRAASTSTDPRVAWYRRNRVVVDRLQLLALAAWIVLSVAMVTRNRAALRAMTAPEWIALLVFPCVAALYYGAPSRSKLMTLRHNGLLKPFIIGFVWSGIVVGYPILFAYLQYGHRTELSLFPILLFVKTLMFVAVLAMLFDIKDQEVDERAGVRTVVTHVGISRTLFHVSLPLTLLGIVTYLSYATMQHLTIERVMLALAPFGLLVAGIISLTRPRSILYYLIAIDGLMLAKALLDILAMQF